MVKTARYSPNLRLHNRKRLNWKVKINYWASSLINIKDDKVD